MAAFTISMLFSCLRRCVHPFLCVCAVNVNGVRPKWNFRLLPLFVMWSLQVCTRLVLVIQISSMLCTRWTSLCRVSVYNSLVCLTSVAVACNSKSVPFKSATRSRHSVKLFHFRATVFLVSRSNQQGVEERNGKSRLLISQFFFYSRHFF